MLALPVLAVRVLEANAFEMGMLATFEYLAFLVIGLPAGAWVDRWRKKRVLVLNDVIRGLALATLPLAWLLDVLTLWQMFAVALVIGVCTVFFDVAYQSYLPDIVEPEQISEGNAKLQATQSVAMIGGPALAGGLIRLVGAPLTLAFDAVSFLGSALFIRRISHVDTPPPRHDRRPLLVEVREGLTFVLRHPLLWRITACTSLSNLFSSMTGALLVLFALRELGLDAGRLGLAMGIGSVGALLGALSTTRISGWVGEGRVIPLSTLLFMPAAALMPLAGTVVPPLVAVTASSFLLSFAVVLYNVAQVSFRQRLCPRPLLGRMNASIRFLVWGTMPIGSFLGGTLGATIGVREVFWLGVAGRAWRPSPCCSRPCCRCATCPASRTCSPLRADDLEGSIHPRRVVVPHPGDAWVLAEPAVLTAGEPAGPGDRAVPGLGLGQVAVEEGQHLLVPEGPLRRASLPQAASRQAPHLLHQPVGPHLVDTLLDPRVQRLAVDVDTDLHGRRVVVALLGQRGGERPAGDLHDLEGPYDAAPVAGHHLPGRLRVDLRETCVQRRGPDLVELGLQPGPHGLVGPRELELVEDRPRVERRPAHQDGDDPAPVAVVDHLARPLLELRDRRRLGDVEDVHQVVPDAATLCDRQLGRADVHAAVDLHRVGVDDLTVQPLRKVQRERALAGRGRPDHRDDGGCGVLAAGHGR